MDPLITTISQIEQVLRSLRIGGINTQTWLKVLSTLSEETQKRVLVILQDPESAKFLTKNMKEKLALFISGDATAASSILQSEEEFLKAIEARD